VFPSANPEVMPNNTVAAAAITARTDRTFADSPSLENEWNKRALLQRIETTNELIILLTPLALFPLKTVTDYSLILGKTPRNSSRLLARIVNGPTPSAR
jgi:hypothetical protein